MCGAALASVGCVLVSLVVGGGAANAALQVQGTVLPVSGSARPMVVDGVHHHVFVTGLVADSKIVVMNEDGTIDTTISDHGAGAMALDGSSLYVARGDDQLIDVFNTATLALTTSIPVPMYQGTPPIVIANGRLWFDGANGDLESVSLDASHTVVDSGIALSVSAFAETAAHPTWLITSWIDGTRLWDVTDPANPTLLAQQATFLTDMSITPDGNTLLGATRNPNLTVLSLPSLSPTGATYKTGQLSAVAVTSSPDGDGVAVAVDGSGIPTPYDLNLYATGDSTPLTSWTNGGGSFDVAYNEDGSKLFLLGQDANGNHVTFATTPTHVGDVSITASTSTITDGGSVTITAHLGTASTDQTLAIWAQPLPSGTATLVTSGTVDVDGNLQAVVSPKHNTTYTVVWAGDASTVMPQPTPAVTVKVRVIMHTAAHGGYTTRRGYRLYHYTTRCGTRGRGCPTFLVYATPLHPRAAFTIRLQRHTARGWRRVFTSTANFSSTGKIYVLVIYGRRTVIGKNLRINFTIKNARDNLGNVSPWVHFRITS